MRWRVRALQVFKKKNYSRKFKTFFIDANSCNADNLNNCFDNDPQEMVNNLLEYGKKIITNMLSLEVNTTII